MAAQKLAHVIADHLKENPQQSLDVDVNVLIHAVSHIFTYASQFTSDKEKYAKTIAKSIECCILNSEWTEPEG